MEHIWVMAGHGQRKSHESLWGGLPRLKASYVQIISNPYLIDFIWLNMCFLWLYAIVKELMCPVSIDSSNAHTKVANKDQVMTPLHFQGSKFLRSQCPTVAPILMRKIPNDANSNEQNMKRTWSYSTIKKNRWVNMRTWSYSTIKHENRLVK